MYPLDIHRYQLHPNPFADVDALEPLSQFPVDRHREKPNPGPFGSCPGVWGKPSFGSGPEQAANDRPDCPPLHGVYGRVAGRGVSQPRSTGRVKR